MFVCLFVLTKIKFNTLTKELLFEETNSVSFIGPWNLPLSILVILFFICVRVRVCVSVTICLTGIMKDSRGYSYWSDIFFKSFSKINA